MNTTLKFPATLPLVHRAKPGRKLAIPDGPIKRLATACGSVGRLASLVHVNRGTLTRWAHRPGLIPPDYLELFASLQQAWDDWPPAALDIDEPGDFLSQIPVFDDPESEEV
jgi:hypothetical protein